MKITHVAEIVNITHVARILEAEICGAENVRAIPVYNLENHFLKLVILEYTSKLFMKVTIISNVIHVISCMVPTHLDDAYSRKFLQLSY